jgi:hypothetical protein
MCGNCTHFDPIPNTARGDLYPAVKEHDVSGLQYGVCRRFPPVPSERINKEQPDLIDIMGRWPLVPSDLWCGEWMEEIA